MEVTFKKKVRKTTTTGRKRSRKSADDDVHSDADNASQTEQTIEEILEDQRLRAQLLKSELSSTSKRTQKPTASNASTDQQYGLHDPKKDGSTNQKLMKLLDGQFTGQSTTTQKDQHEELMNKYIEEKLQKKRFNDPDSEQKDVSALGNEDEALVAILDHLKPDVVPKPEESGNGGVLIWNTGIAEVELPSSYAEKTIHATKLALDRELAMSKSASKITSSALPANFSTDFNRHRGDYVAELKSLNKDEQKELGFRTVGKHQASDDLAVSRFRKFERRKKYK